MQDRRQTNTNVSHLPPEVILTILGLVHDHRAALSFSEVCTTIWHACRSALCAARTFALDFTDHLLLEDTDVRRHRRASKTQIYSMVSLNEDKYRCLLRWATTDRHEMMPRWKSATIMLKGQVHPHVVDQYASVLSCARAAYADPARSSAVSSSNQGAVLAGDRNECRQMLPIRVSVSDSFEADDDQVDRLVDIVLEGISDNVLDLRFLLDWKSSYRNTRPVTRLLAGLSAHIWYLYVRNGRLSFKHLFSVLTQPFSSIISIDLMGTRMVDDDPQGDDMLKCILSAMMRSEDSFKMVSTLNVIHTGIATHDIKVPARTLAPNLRFLYTGFGSQRDVTVTTWTTHGHSFDFSASIISRVGRGAH